MMTLTAIYGIYGEEKGIDVYKYYDFHSLLATVSSQLLISFFGSDYFSAMIFFAALNFVGLTIVSKIYFPPLHQTNE